MSPGVVAVYMGVVEIEVVSVGKSAVVLSAVGTKILSGKVGIVWIPGVLC